MQLEMKKTRMCVHEYIIYIYILKCTKMYKRYLNKQTNKKKKKKQIITMHAAARYTYTVAAADW